MIKQKQALTLVDVADLAGDSENAVKIKAFVKKFKGVDLAKAKKLKESLIDLDLVKLKEEDIVSIINFMPQDAEDLNKVLAEVSLNAEETERVLNAIRS